MRRVGDVVHVDQDDSATLRAIAAERGLSTPVARRLLELGDEPSDDDELRPRVAVLYRLVLESLGPYTMASAPSSRNVPS